MIEEVTVDVDRYPGELDGGISFAEREMVVGVGWVSRRAEAFAGRMLDLLNGGALAVMISVGHGTGLLDALREHGAATSQELADAAGSTSATCASGSAR